MPLITALEPASGRKGGYLLHLDGEAICRVPDDLRPQLHLVVGEDLTRTQVAAIVRECEIAETQEVALRYLSYRPRTHTEVLRYLRGKGHGTHAETIVARCEELGYVDDEAYALAFARERIRLRPRGSPKLVSELLARGVDRQTAERAAAAALREENVTEDELLRAVALRRIQALRRLEPSTARRRLTGFLRRRGFPAVAVRAVVDELLSDPNGDGSS